VHELGDPLPREGGLLGVRFLGREGEGNDHPELLRRPNY
jgi:hypothetical protein